MVRFEIWDTLNICILLCFSYFYLIWRYLAVCCFRFLAQMHDFVSKIKIQHHTSTFVTKKAKNHPYLLHWKKQTTCYVTCDSFNYNFMPESKACNKEKPLVNVRFIPIRMQITVSCLENPSQVKSINKMWGWFIFESYVTHSNLFLSQSNSFFNY